jgi:glucose/mannose transport system permease protein
MPVDIFCIISAGISDELIDASQVDGAGMLRTSVTVPLIAIPAFAVSVIWQFTSAWNDSLFGLVITNPSSAPRPSRQQRSWRPGGALPRSDGERAGGEHPTLLVYILMGRFFMRGLMAGALKG